MKIKNVRLESMDKMDQTIGSRIRETRGSLSQADFASKLGVNKNLLGKYERNESVPGGEFLAHLNKVCGTDITWLLTGRHIIENVSVNNTGTFKQNAVLDEELNARVVDGIYRLYKDEGVRLPPMDLGRLTARVYSELETVYADRDERLIGLKGALQQLRRELQAAPAAPSATSPTGKRSA